MPSPPPAPSLDALFARLTESGLLRRLIQLAREEDLGPDAGAGDITSRVTIDEHAQGEAAIVAREPGHIAGMRIAPQVLQAFAPNVVLDVRAADGYAVPAGHTLATLRGPLREILAAERTLLNFVGRLSGIATLTATFVASATEGAKAAGLKHAPKVLDTRKTTPGMRMVEKYAVACGGGACHRIGLYDAVLIKDNHIAGVPPTDLAKFLTNAAAKARVLASPTDSRPASGAPPRTGLAFIEAEVDTLAQLQSILNAGGCSLDVVLLDNMTPDQLREAVRLRDASSAKVELEASGGVSFATIGFIAATGVDRISVGQLTHSAKCLDVGLDIAPLV